MKDPVVAYKERLEIISSLTKKEEYANCFNIAKNLTNFSWTMELKDEVFISEILEALFSELNLLIQKYKIPPEKREELKKELVKYMEKLISIYDEKNSDKLYDCLKDFRYCATFHQLNAWQKYPERLEGRYA